MKRNLVPLFAIAFVVAAISTGVFYGLFAGKLRANSSGAPHPGVVIAARDLDRGTVVKLQDIRVSDIHGAVAKDAFESPLKVVGETLSDPVPEGQPIAASRLVPSTTASGAPGDVPAGMRALSIHVYDSNGLMPLLHRGSRIDVQAVLDRNGSADLRTILQNVEVFSVAAQAEQPQSGRPSLPVVTILTAPNDADILALGDAGSRLRLVLRNATDKSTHAARVMAIAALFDNMGTPHPAATTTPVRDIYHLDSDKSINLSVRALRVSPAAISEFDEVSSDAAIQVRSVPGSAVRHLSRKSSVEIVSDTQVTADTRTPAVFRAGAGEFRLKVKFAPESQSAGQWSLRVSPQIIWTRQSGSETHAVERSVTISGETSIVIAGLLKGGRDRALLEQMFPGHEWKSGELWLLITPAEANTSAAKAGAAAARLLSVK